MSSLRVMLKKLNYKGKISDEELEKLLKKLEGHDRTLRIKAISEYYDNDKKK